MDNIYFAVYPVSLGRDVPAGSPYPVPRILLDITLLFGG